MSQSNFQLHRWKGGGGGGEWGGWGKFNFLAPLIRNSGTPMFLKYALCL